MTIHLLKLSVGTESVEDLEAWQRDYARRLPGGLPRHVTRMWPKRGDALLDGGSIYWIIKGQISARQKILRLDPIEGDDGVTRCALILDPTLIRTALAPRRPFQGWRYLLPEDAPRDLPKTRKGDDDLPADLAKALAELGLR